MSSGSGVQSSPAVLQASMRHTHFPTVPLSPLTSKKKKKKREKEQVSKRRGEETEVFAAVADEVSAVRAKQQQCFLSLPSFLFSLTGQRER